MKIAMIGYGKMGQIITSIAQQRGHEVVTIDPHNEAAHHTAINEESLSGVDVCIDFTHPSVLVENVKQVAACKKNLVVGTTGWYDSMDEVTQTATDASIGFMHASNFSIGMNMFFRIVGNAAQLVNAFDDYDVSGLEFHHNKKADSPSGTARSIAEILEKNINRKKKITYDIVDRQIDPEELHFASVRCGSIPGTHTVVMDSTADTLELTHRARNREGFALGAVLAAEWMKDKNGVFTIDDFMNEIVRG